MNVNINEIVNNYYFSLNCREVSYEIFKNIIILLSFLLLTGCTAVQSENESINNEPQAEETIQEIETVSEVEETIQEIKTVSEDNPLSFIQTMDSLDEMRVEYQDGMELIITNQDFLDRFMEGLKNKGYVAGGADTDVEGIDSKTYAWYTVYFHGHTFEIGNYHTKIDGYNVSTISKNYAEEPFLLF